MTFYMLPRPNHGKDTAMITPDRPTDNSARYNLPPILMTSHPTAHHGACRCNDCLDGFSATDSLRASLIAIIASVCDIEESE